MRILIISDHADPLAEIGSKEAGGQNIYVLYLAKYLCQSGILVDIYTRWDRKNKREMVRISDKLRIIRVKAGPKKYMPRDNFLEVTNEFADNILKRIVKEQLQYDIIHSNYWFSGIIGVKIFKKIKKPLVHVYHSIGQVRFEALKKLKTQQGDRVFFHKRVAAEREIAKSATSIISTSPIEKQIIKKLFSVSGKKIKMIPVGVDIEVFKPLKTSLAKNWLQYLDMKKIVLYVGRIEWRKGLGTLLYAFREVLRTHPEARLCIIGGGKSRSTKNLEQAEYQRLNEIAIELHIKEKINFLGSKKQSELYKYYSASDVCVVPSYYEPFGIVPLEAMACGTPVVVSKTGGLQYTVNDGVTGHLAEPRNYEDLAKKINLVLKKGKDFYKTNCLKRIKNDFMWEKIAIQYIKYFNYLIKNK